MFKETLKRFFDWLVLVGVGEVVQVILDAENDFGIEFPSNPDLKILTVGDLYRLIVTELQEKGPVDYQAVWLATVGIVCRYTEKSPEEINPDLRFGMDLGLD